MTNPTRILTDDTDPSDLDADTLINLIEASHGSLDTFLTDETVTEATKDVSIIPAHERPNTLTGTTQRIETGYDHIYVNINTDETGEPVELFTTYGQSGGFTKSLTEAIHNLVTLALRSHADPEDVIAQLRGIRSPQITYDHGARVDSIPDAIGLALERVVDDDLPEIGAPDSRQSSLTQLDDPNSDTAVDTSGDTDDGEATETTTAAANVPSDQDPASPLQEIDPNQPESTYPPEAAQDGKGETTGATSGQASEDTNVPRAIPADVSTSRPPDPEVDPRGAPDAKPGTDPHLDAEATSSSSPSPAPHTNDTEPFPDCGSLDIFYSEGGMTCQNCGYSDCG